MIKNLLKTLSGFFVFIFLLSVSFSFLSSASNRIAATLQSESNVLGAKTSPFEAYLAPITLLVIIGLFFATKYFQKSKKK